MLNLRFQNTRVDQQDATAVRCFGGCERVVVSKYGRVTGHICFRKKKIGSLNFAPESKLAFPAERCFELCLGEVMGISRLRNANIKIVVFEKRTAFAAA
jgi:hypothetical protein